MNLVLAPLEFVISLVTGLVGVFTRFAPVIFAAVAAIGTFTLAINAQKIALGFAAAAQGIYTFAINAYTVATKAARVAQMALNAAMKANPAGLLLTGLAAGAAAVGSYAYATKDATDASEDNTAALKAEEDALKSKAEAEEKATSEKLKRQQDEIDAKMKKDEADRKALQLQEEAQRKAEQAAIKLAEDRKRYGEQEIANARARAALLADLQARVIDEQIKNIKDGKEREIAETNAAFKKQLDDLNKNYDSLKLAAEEREKEVAEIFGKNSKELLSVQKANAEQLVKVTDEQAKIEAQIKIQQIDAIKKINADFRAEDLEKAKQTADDLRQFRDDALNSEIEFIDSVGSMREQKNQEILNKKLIQETDELKREEILRLAAEQRIIDNIALIRNKLQALDDAESQIIDENGKIRADATQEQYDAILKARQALNTELSEEELKQTETVRKSAEERTKAIETEFEKQSAKFLEGLQLLDGFLDALNAREQKRIDESIERSDEREQQLTQDLENATGLRRQYLQQQIDAELKAREKLEKEKEALATKAAKRDKAIAIIQSIIQGALATLKAFNIGGPPAAILAGIFAAAQTAVIAAQPLAEGGAVTPVALPDSGGKVVGAQNIPQTSKGDNVLVAARVGETFLNRKQTAKLRPILSAHKIPGFASGGLLGAPNLSGVTQSGAIRAFNERTNAIQGQVLESKVYLVTDELHRDTANGERIKKKVTLR